MKNKINFITGETYTLAELFSEDRRVVIPDLQRDYCWGDKLNRRATGEVGELVSGFIQNLIEQFENGDDTDLNMGMFYGYEIPANHIQLCDGQQRLTTLYLLLGMLNKRVGKFQRHLISDFELNEDDREPYLNYAIRESSLYFLSDLVCEFFINNKEATVESITEAQWYFNDYDHDPSICSMINAMMIIESKLQGNEEDWLQRFGDWVLNKLTFLYFDMENRTNGEETFVVINTTGEPLSATQNLKPLVIAADINKEVSGKDQIWEEIETWFWKKRSKDDNDTADAGFAEFLRWVWMLEKCDEKLEMQDEDGSRMNYLIQPILKGIVKDEFPYKDISITIIRDYWEGLAWLVDENSPIDFKKKAHLLSPKFNAKTNNSILEQNEYYVLLPVLKYIYQNHTANKADETFRRKVKRVYEFFNNTIRIPNVAKSVNSLVREALYIVDQLKDQDILSILDMEKVSDVIITDEERLKLQILRDSPDKRLEIEEMFWMLQEKPIWNGEIMPILNWASENQVFSYDKLISYSGVLDQLFDKVEHEKVITLLRRCMILMTSNYRPVSRGSYITFGWKVSDWKELLCRNNEDTKALLEILVPVQDKIVNKLEELIKNKIEEYSISGIQKDYLEFAESDFLMSFMSKSQACDMIWGNNDWQISTTGGVGRHTKFFSRRNAYIFKHFAHTNYNDDLHQLQNPNWSVWCWADSYAANCAVFQSCKGVKLDVRFLSSMNTDAGTLQIDLKPINDNELQHRNYYDAIINSIPELSGYEKPMEKFDLKLIGAEIDRLMLAIDNIQLVD